ncbi:hypothetical protein OPV22_011493 [Ensete ventricosum]|uniref:Epidermal patterning factor-like protein n=1 Tax=Ensete ventricosum TaxID=4639 RepID=A0AAV8RDK6_ENSVE|nr:hypothetical protein OPV22_011493 [Ensete ventricosum]
MILHSHGVSLTRSIAIAGMNKCTPSRGVCFFGALFLLSTVCAGLRPNPDAVTAASDDRDNRRKAQDDLVSTDTGADSTGSSLPDCSHACGPCFPCKRVMVIFKCSLAESCPVGYRCTCDGKYYHVPSQLIDAHSSPCIHHLRGGAKLP